MSLHHQERSIVQKRMFFKEQDMLNNLGFFFVEKQDFVKRAPAEYEKHIKLLQDLAHSMPLDIIREIRNAQLEHYCVSFLENYGVSISDASTLIAMFSTQSLTIPSINILSNSMAYLCPESTSSSDILHLMYQYLP